LNVLVILSHSGGLLLIEEMQHPRSGYDDIACNPYTRKSLRAHPYA